MKLGNNGRTPIVLTGYKVKTSEETILVSIIEKTEEVSTVEERSSCKALLLRLGLIVSLLVLQAEVRSAKLPTLIPPYKLRGELEEGVEFTSTYTPPKWLLYYSK